MARIITNDDIRFEPRKMLIKKQRFNGHEISLYSVQNLGTLTIQIEADAKTLEKYGDELNNLAELYAAEYRLYITEGLMT